MSIVTKARKQLGFVLIELASVVPYVCPLSRPIVRGLSYKDEIPNWVLRDAIRARGYMLRWRFPAALGFRFFCSAVSFPLLLPVLSWIASTNRVLSPFGPPA